VILTRELVLCRRYVNLRSSTHRENNAKAHFAAVTAAFEGSHAAVLHDLSPFAKSGRTGISPHHAELRCVRFMREPSRLNADPV
jgi:hypothetical protein